MKKLEITLRKTETLKAKPDWNNLGFGRHFTDHMFVMSWNSKEGWHDAEIKPYGPFTLDPAAMVLHYSQEIFEGLKAYHGADGSVLLFRPLDNLNRLNRSAVRMCMPEIPAEEVLEALKQMVALDRAWVPQASGASLYIRPAMIATEAAVGLHPANEYLFFIICCPVGAYYAEGFKPTKIYVEDQYVRATAGGVGEAKTGGNYAASLKAFAEAKAKGCTQVLWLDAAEHKYVEEVGTSNIFFVINGELVTPPLGGTILPGITRDTVLKVAADWGIKANERRISMDEIIAAAADGSLTEAFGSGTAAVIAPVGEFLYQERSIIIGGGKTGPIAQRLFDGIQQMQRGILPDTHGWLVRAI
ncbi:MAG: branched-chain amino acid aminotransferase [Candidatus Electronema aureum]|uniref:Branched-chain-amino-acid aminotransferase n=1 Tax=Candidatus Electronema aureum TaxID=2005002 RepID=A0A521G0R1_9BACT|nr:MAG: branched-chain amino acid aminotransferase [Candidatus Electronema aureum]